jgi:hypothetical protein
MNAVSNGRWSHPLLQIRHQPIPDLPHFIVWHPARSGRFQHASAGGCVENDTQVAVIMDVDELLSVQITPSGIAQVNGFIHLRASATWA